MKTSANGIAFVQAREGFTSLPTDDNGHQMWGYGHDRRNGEPVPRSISLVDAYTLLLDDLATLYEPNVNQLAPWATQNQFDALIDFAYNLGVGALATMLHHGAAAVPAQMPAWCYEHVNGVLTKSDGLAKRRQLEVELYES